MILILITCFCLIPQSAKAQGVSGELFSRINALRAEQGLSSYSLNSALNVAAQNQAQWMVDTSRVSHVQEDGSSPKTRAQANGYNSQWVSENIYMGSSASVDSAWNFWLNSPIHYAGLTSPNYRDIGIATAQGQGGQSFVLVFGVPGSASTTTSSNNSSSSSNNQAPESAPIAIVGYDEVGNIQYQLQAGDTLGQVLLLFGYTWDDLNALLDLNQFTEADVTALDVGQIVLVPPPQGTYTPTPVLDPTVTLTAIPSATDSPQATANAPTAILQSTIIPTNESSVTSAIIPTAIPQIATIEVTPETIGEELGQPVTYVAVTVSASPIPTLQVNSQPLVSATATPPIEEEPASEKNNSGPPTWLVAAIIAQIAILLYASFEYFRRK